VIEWQVACNLELIATLNNFCPMDGIRLSLHTGIGAGADLLGYFVGGVQQNWEFFVAGLPIQQMADAGEEAKAGIRAHFHFTSHHPT
jgi:hypothetical protein